MLEKRWLLMLVSIAAIAVLAGCSDDDGGVGLPGGLTSEQQFQAVHDAAITYINGPAPAPITAATLNTNRDDYTVIDIRTETHYDTLGHIEGAIHTELGTLLADLADGTIPTDKPIVVACYSGQSAGHAALALRVLGYEAYILKWGMSSWNTALAGSWNNNTANLAQPADIETSGNTLTTEYAWPTLDTGATTADEAVDARVAAMLNAGFQGVSFTEMKTEGLDSYFILNYFGMDDYLGQGSSGVPGHIVGAFQFTPKASLAMDEQLKYLPTDKPIAVYCWTGQTASQVAAYLNMLGYEAYDLKFSSNALWYDQLTGHKWIEANESNNFPLVTTP